ncbi:RIIA lysis inhibitor [Pseudomonas phage Littlefix]|uniref:Alpha-galactosidase n=1 Tax=Pseudomonas phage Littlefix TaxID=2079289 RepID=A0A2K9VHW8_9CAUD|nr:RIIA lysis inhibitor [Pseudomonas phage Littlefix]AUV61878.1 alpha-galactosidase [Pseudomonas phage Littlefix]
MEVTQKDDHITHAVAGQHESVEMGMSSSAALMHIMSAALYTHPELATVREPICNAWDAHITAGKTDQPIIINVTERAFSVQDFGSGIPHHKIGQIYGTYGDSTKREDSDVTGGFGLGSKAPFAYTDLFEVVSCNEGTKTIYRVSKSSMEKGGKPAIHKVVDMPTEDTGITVSFGLKEGHRSKFLKLVKEVVALGAIKAVINEGADDVDILPLEDSPTGYIISSVSGTVTDTINLRYGNVVYPIPCREEYAHEFKIVMKFMDHLWGDANIIFMAAPNTVSIAPSRENLILTDCTVATIKKALGQFDPKLIERVEETNKQNLNQLRNKTLELEKIPTSYSDINQAVTIDITGKEGKRLGLLPYAYTVKEAHQQQFLRNTDKDVPTDLALMRRIKKLVDSRQCNSVLGKEIIKYLKVEKRQLENFYKAPVRGMKPSRVIRNKEVINSVRKHVFLPVYEAIKAEPRVSKDRFQCVESFSWGGPTFCRPKDFRISDYSTAAGFLFPRVIIGTTNARIGQYLKDQNQNRYSHDRDHSWMVYRSSTQPASIQAAVDMFQKLGFEVHNVAVAAAPRKKLADFVGPMLPSAPKAKPRKKLLSLNQSYDRSSRTYLLSTARGHKEGECESPLAWVILRSKSAGGPGPKRIGYMSIEQSAIVRKLLGDRIAVVTSAQADALKLKGVVSVQEMINKYVNDKVAESPLFKRYMAFGFHASERSEYGNGADQRIYKLMHQLSVQKNFMDSIGLRFSVDAETAMLVKFMEHEDDECFPALEEVKKQVKPHEMFTKMYQLIKTSEWAPFINMGALGTALEMAGKDLSEDSIPLKIIRELVPFKKLHSRQVAT